MDVPSKVGGNVRVSKGDEEEGEVVRNQRGDKEECVLSGMGEDTLDHVAREEGRGGVGVLSGMGVDTLDQVAQYEGSRKVGVLSRMGENTLDHVALEGGGDRTGDADIQRVEPVEVSGSILSPVGGNTCFREVQVKLRSSLREHEASGVINFEWY